MKKKKIINFCLIPASILLLSGCQKTNAKIQITYGKYASNELTEIDYFGVQERMEGKFKNENFLLYIHPENSSCRCTLNFETIMKNFISEKNYLIYSVSRNEFLDMPKNFNLPLQPMMTGGSIEDSPRFVIVSKGKIKAKYINPDVAFFSNYDSFKKEIDSKCSTPSLYYVDGNYLDNRLNIEKKKTIVSFVRSSCGDCSYLLPNFLWGYFEQRDGCSEVLIYDLDPLYIQDKDLYQNEKNKYGLSYSGDIHFGYEGGVVPTTQVYENGNLKDASVYFNDQFSLVDSKWTLTTTYYTKARCEYCSYYNNSYAIEGLIEEEENLTIIDNVGYWNKDKASVYHNKFLKSFLDLYL